MRRLLATFVAAFLLGGTVAPALAAFHDPCSEHCDEEEGGAPCSCAACPCCTRAPVWIAAVPDPAPALAVAERGYLPVEFRTLPATPREILHVPIALG